MNVNRLLAPLLAIALVLVDACALRAAEGHYWPETPSLCLMALFTSQLAVLVAATVLYRGLAVLRIAAAVCLAAVWCRSGAFLLGDVQDWAAMATLVALPLATLVLTVRWLVTRQAQYLLTERTTSGSGFSLGDLLVGVTVTGLLFAAVRAMVDSPLGRPEFALSLVAAVLSVPFVLTLLSTELKTLHVLVLLPVTIAGGLALAATGIASREVCCLWAAIHAALLSGSLMALRAGGLRILPSSLDRATHLDQERNGETVPFERGFHTSC